MYGKPVAFILMRRLLNILSLVLLPLLLLAGCSLPAEEGHETLSGTNKTSAEAPVYERSTSQFQLAEDANIYMMDFAQNGFFYFVMGVKDTTGDAGEPENEYRFYYQAYDSGEAVPFCVVTDGYVRDFTGITRDGGMRLSVLRIGSEACILEYDESGNNCGKIVIDEAFNSLEEFPKLLAMPDDGYAIGMADEVFLLDSEGQITETFRLDGSVRELYIVGEDELFATVLVEGERGGTLCLTRLDAQKGNAKEVRKLPVDLVRLFAFEDGFVSVYRDSAFFFQADKEDEEILIDLNRQSFLASQIQFVYGNREEIKLVSIDQSAPEKETYLFTLKKPGESGDSEVVQKPEQEIYAPDGRRIVRVAIPQGCLFQVEFHARKYNQTSDKTFIEVERFEGSLEDFLGKGNRPDVIMFNEHTEIDEYIQKGVLENLLPLFEGQEKYSLEDIIPKARELLGAENGDGMYAVAGYFRLLGRTSDGTEYGVDGKCDAVSYLKWYDKFLTENEIEGVGGLENLLYANLPAFYDENTAETFFASEEFRELMQTYKAVYNRHKRDIAWWEVGIENTSDVYGIARGPEWYISYSGVRPNVKIEGLPGPDGENHVYMRFQYPMSILSTSDCKEAAFDFIMYYNSLALFLMVGDAESNYGMGGITYAYFSIFEENMKNNIYESKEPYSRTRNGEQYFFTDEQNAQLKDLIDRAVSTTKAQEDIYNMLMEEMDAYFQGGKDLDSVCDILQNRAELYLEEKR